MKLRCDGRALAGALSLVSRALRNRTTVPALNMVLLEAGAGHVRVTATDLELRLRRSVPAEVSGEGAVAVPGRLLAEFAATLGDEPVDLAGSESSLTVSTPSFRTELRGVPAADFPQSAFCTEDGIEIEVERPALVEAIEDTCFASSTDEARPVLTGVLVCAEDGGLTFAATDGYRVAERCITREGGDDSLRVTVPSRALADVARTFRDGGAVVRVLVAATGGHIQFSDGGSEVVSRLLDGRFPSYRSIFPDSWSTTVELDAAELVRRLRALSAFARDGARAVRLATGDATLQVTASAGQVGEGETRLPAAVDGAATRVACNVRYLLEGLSRVSGRASLRLDGPLAPLVVRRPSGDPYTYLLAPVVRG